MKVNTGASKEETQMANKHCRKNSTPLATMEMQLKTTLVFQFPLVRRAIVPKANDPVVRRLCKKKLLLCKPEGLSLIPITHQKPGGAHICNLALIQQDGSLKQKNCLEAC